MLTPISVELRPLHMSPVNRFPRSRLATLSFVKLSMCSCGKPGWPGYRDLDFCDRELGNRDENFPYEHSSPRNWDETF